MYLSEKQNISKRDLIMREREMVEMADDVEEKNDKEDNKQKENRSEAHKYIRQFDRLIRQLERKGETGPQFERLKDILGLLEKKYNDPQGSINWGSPDSWENFKQSVMSPLVMNTLNSYLNELREKYPRMAERINKLFGPPRATFEYRNLSPDSPTLQPIDVADAEFNFELADVHYGEDVDMNTPLTNEQKIRYHWDEALARFREVNRPIKNRILEQWVRYNISKGWRPGDIIPNIHDITIEEKDNVLYVTAYSYEEAYAEMGRLHYKGLWYWVGPMEKKVRSEIQKYDSVNEYNRNNHIYSDALVERLYKISGNEELLKAVKDSKKIDHEFAALVKDVQKKLYQPQEKPRWGMLDDETERRVEQYMYSLETSSNTNVEISNPSAYSLTEKIRRKLSETRFKQKYILSDEDRNTLSGYAQSIKDDERTHPDPSGGVGHGVNVSKEIHQRAVLEAEQIFRDIELHNEEVDVYTELTTKNYMPHLMEFKSIYVNTYDYNVGDTQALWFGRGKALSTYQVTNMREAAFFIKPTHDKPNTDLSLDGQLKKNLGYQVSPAAIDNVLEQLRLEYIDQKARETEKKRIDQLHKQLGIEKKNSNDQYSQEEINKISEAYISGIEQEGLKYLQDEEKEVAKWNIELRKIYAKPENTRTPQDNARINEIKALKKNKRIFSSHDLFDPNTGDFIDKNDPKADADVIEFNQGLERELIQYQNSDAGKVMQLLAHYYWQSKAYRENMYTKYLDIDKSTFGVYWDKPTTHMYYKGDLDDKYYKFGLLQKYLALNKILLLNEDPGYIERGAANFFDNMKYAMDSSTILGVRFGDPTDNTKYMIDGWVQALQGTGLLTKEQEARARLTFSDKLALAIGGAIPAMIELAIVTLLTEGAGTVLSGGTRFAEIATMMSAEGLGGRFSYNLLSNSMRGGMNYGLAGQGFVTGFIEEAVGTLWETSRLAKLMETTKYGKAFKLLMRPITGAAGETVSEYCSQYVQTLIDSGFDVNKAAEDTFDTDNPLEKLALTYMSALTIGAPYHVLVQLRSAVYTELSKPDIDEKKKQHLQEALKLGEKLNVTGGQKNQAGTEFDYKKPDVKPVKPVPDSDLHSARSIVALNAEINELKAKLKEVMFKKYDVKLATGILPMSFVPPQLIALTYKVGRRVIETMAVGGKLLYKKFELEMKMHFTELDFTSPDIQQLMQDIYDDYFMTNIKPENKEIIKQYRKDNPDTEYTNKELESFIKDGKVVVPEIKTEPVKDLSQKRRDELNTRINSLGLSNILPLLNTLDNTIQERFYADFEKVPDGTLQALNNDPDLLNAWKEIEFLHPVKTDPDFLKVYKQMKAESYALEHVFSGHAAGMDSVKGVHHHEALTTKTTNFEVGDLRIKPGTENPIGYKGVYEGLIERFDGTGWVPKTGGQPSGYSTMFPKDWTKQRTIEELAYAKYKGLTWMPKYNSNGIQILSNSYKGISSNGVEIEFYIGSKTMTAPPSVPTTPIISVFPMK